MKKRYFSLFLLIILSLIALVSCDNKKNENNNNGNEIEQIVGKTLYASPDGNVNNDGSEENPLTFSAAVSIAEPGDTILLEGGVYNYISRIQLMKSGVFNGYINVRPKNDGERVIFDFSKQPLGDSNRGIQIYGDFWHFYDIEVTGAGDNGLYVAGSFNIIENCDFYNNRDTGLQLGRAYSGDNTIDRWPSYNLIKNCTSFGNYDANNFGENADGFAAKLTIGFGNVFDGCIAFRNSDDGWDLYAKDDSGNIGTVVLYNCVSFENGYLPYQIERNNVDGSTYMSYNTLNGDGIGFKLGGSVMEGDVLLNNCLSFDNKLHGFGDNSNPGTIVIKNCTAVNNCSGLNEDGSISSVRGITHTQNKSNNFDLARDSKSYNNYYGLVSYINNQNGFDPDDGDSSYNTDQFRGSVAYSIFQTGHTSNGEVYKTFTSYEDASIYHSEKIDIAFSSGTEYTGMSDDCFEDLSSMNATCKDVDDLPSLLKINDLLRNEDHSINVGNRMKIKDPTLLTYANGKAIGANLSKSSYSEYEHYDILNFKGCKNRDEVEVQAAANSLEILGAEDAIYQDFEIAKLIHGTDITWTSSNPEIAEIQSAEHVSVSQSVFGVVKINVPEEDQKVTLTANLAYGSARTTKTFEITVKSRNRSIGSMVSNSPSSIRVSVYENFITPRIYPLDASSNTISELPLSTYEMTYSYRYATDRKSKYSVVDGVYTSVAGVYEVTVTAYLKTEPNRKSVYKYNVYVVNPDCNIDLIEETISVNLIKDGFSVSGDVSNMYGDIYAITSPTKLSNLTANDIINHPDCQVVEINTDAITANFIADNTSTDVYYGYYVVTNKNNSIQNDVREFSTSIVDVTTKEQFYSLATSGSTGNETATSTTIYVLKNDLDFADYEWKIAAKGVAKEFISLLNGDGHTVKNINIEDESSDKNVNVFYKVSYGTVMNIKFEEISIFNKDVAGGKQVGIFGELQGGYLHNIKMKNISARGREGIGALVGQVTGEVNFISQCSLINENTEEKKYVISATNKYAGGIVGNAQINTDQSVFELTVTDCYVNAYIGDGNDAGGNNGGIIGRVKNEKAIYKTVVERCYYIGTVQGKGNYNAGIVGDFDNGLGYVKINSNISDCVLILDGEVLDAQVAYEFGAVQKYAHKNSNPIVGRSVWAEGGVYETHHNYGTWKEFYSQYILSESIVFDLSINDDGEYIGWSLTKTFIDTYLKYDLVNVWLFNEDTGELTLR